MEGETLIDPDSVKRQEWRTERGVKVQFVGRGRGGGFDEEGWFKYVRGTRQTKQGPSGRTGLRIIDPVSVDLSTGEVVLGRREGGVLFKDNTGQLRRGPSHEVYGVWSRLSVEVEGVDVPVKEMLERRAARE